MKKIILGLFSFVFMFSVFGQKVTNNASIKTEYSYQYALIEASRQKMIGNINEAINLYNTCISSNPECDVAYYELGTVYSALGENQKSEENLGKAYKLDPRNYWYGIAYSELLKLNNDSKKSLKVLKKTRNYNRNNVLTIDFKIAEIYSEAKKYDKALKVLDNLEKENGLSEMISLKKVEIFKLKKDYKSAEAAINDLINKAPDENDYRVLLAEFYTEIGDTLKAVQTYENAYKLDSSNIYAITNLAEFYSAMGNDTKAYFYLNRAFLNKNIPVGNKIQTMVYLNKDRDLIKKNRALIEEMVNSLLLQYPDNYDVKTVSYDFYNGLEEHEKALAIIKDILTKKKDDYIIWQQALYNASMLENYDELISIGEEALKYFPNKNEIYLFVGIAYYQKDNYEEAYKILSNAYNSIDKKEAIRAQFLPFLAESAYNTNRKEEAYRYYDLLIAADPANDYTKNNYSYYLALDSMDLLKAKDLSYSTIVNSPENSTFLDTYAWILFKLGDYSNARYYSEKALSTNGESDPDLIFHYAEILNALKDKELAEKFYRLALSKGFNKETIESKLKTLYEY